MKTLLVLVLILGSFSTFAFEGKTSAADKLTSYLPLGTYTGQTDDGVACGVYVSEANFPKKDIQVRVVSGKSDLTNLIEENSVYSYKDYKKEFIQTERSLIGVGETNYVERIIRTVNAGEGKQYVVVSYSVVLNRSRDTQTAECVVDLN